MDPIEPSQTPARRTVGRRELLIGGVAVVGLVGVAGVATTLISRRGDDQAVAPSDSTQPPETTVGRGGRARVEYAHDVPRIPQDPSTGVPGWPMGPAGAQLVQAPV